MTETQVELIHSLIGATLLSATVNENEDVLTFALTDGRECVFYHDQDCCEHVGIESIVGDLSDLVGSPLVMAEEVSSAPDPDEPKDYDDSHTWTFYKFATANGYVTVRWLGQSNGYYSEGVSWRVSPATEETA